MTNFASDGGPGVETSSRLAAPLLPPIPAGTSLIVRGHKRCCTCQVDVSNSKRTLDLQGRFHCLECWNKRVRAGTAIDLVPSRQPEAATEQRALKQMARENALAVAQDPQSPPPNSIVVYVNPPTGPAAERGKVAFFFGFYATAGVIAALVILMIGAAAFFMVQNAWQKHEIAMRDETPIQQEFSAPAAGATSVLQTVHLEAGVDGDSTLRVSAVNGTAQPLKKVIVQVMSSLPAPIASLDLGEMEVGQMKTVFVPVPGLSKLVLAGKRVRLRATTDTP